MRLFRLRLANYRGVDKSEVQFGPNGLTIVEGPNETGKTSLSEAIGLLFDYLDSSKHRSVEAVRPVHHDAGPEIELEAESGPYRFTYFKRFYKKFKFKTIEGNWFEPKYMLVRQPFQEISEDENLRAEFAPDDYVLSEEYQKTGVTFFIVCRGKLDAPVEDMLDWVLRADTNKKRKAALHYLLKGELGDRLSYRLREDGIAGTWFAHLQSDDRVFTGWGPAIFAAR